MKKTPLLHSDLSRVIASLGHGDLVVIGDAGLPIPDGPERIDLAVTRGVPAFDDVLGAVLAEMQVERVMVAHESFVDGRVPAWAERAGAPVERLSHDELKRLSARARAVVRTGECTPYCNIVLASGVVF